LHLFRTKKIKIPTNHYLGEVLDSAYYGNFNTKIRFSLKINDSIITSSPILFSLDSTLFLPYNQRVLIKLDNLLNDEKNLKPKENKIIQITKCMVLRENHKLLESIKCLQNTLVEFPNFSKAQYLLGNYLLIFASKNEKSLNDMQVNIIISEAINLWQSVDKDNQYFYNKAKDNIMSFKKYLLSENQLLNKNDDNLIIINGKYYSSFHKLFKKPIELQLKVK